MSSTKQRVCVWVSGILGLVMLIVGVVLIHVFTEMIHSEVRENVPLSKGSESYKNWQKPSTPIYFQVWMWDIVNHMEVLKGEKAVVVEMGPYTYREHREKIDVSWYENGTMFYREKKSFVFNRDMSVGSENDTFHTVNLPMLTVATMVRYQPKLIKDAVQVLLDLTNESLFVELTVKQLMWGYTDQLIHDLDKFLKPLNKTLPEVFGLFAGQNNTDDGLYQMYSGLAGTDNFGQIISWNGLHALDYWTTDVANAINGSDGTLYPPFFDKHATKYMFSTDICRSIGMDYVSPARERGIDMYRYMATASMFANHTENPFNEGFCTPKGDCLPSGLLNASICREGAPVIMSMPHFLDSAPEVINGVRGLHPSQAEHNSFIELECLTGVTMNAGKKLQLNAYIEKIDGIIDTEHFAVPVYMPIMWLNESALISESDAKKFREAVTDMIKLTQAVQYCLIGVGAVILVIILAVVIRKQFARKQSEKSMNINSPESDDEPLLSNHTPNHT